MKVLVVVIPALLALSSCSTPPKPPSVDEARKRVANSEGSVELQACRGALHNAQLQVTERTRFADSARAAFNNLAAARQADLARPEPTEDMRSVVYTVLFAYGSSRVNLAEELSTRLLRDAMNAPLILLSGRTDGETESQAESRIARQRSEAVRSFLIAAGVSTTRVRTTWQPVGDHVAENASAGGRALNRRVEIQIYRLAPRPVMSLAAAD